MGPSDRLRKLGPSKAAQVAFFSWSALVLCFVDRMTISVALIPLAEAHGWTAGTQGLILSAFFYGYMCLQIPAGILAKRHTGRKILGAAVAGWSLATMLTPAASASLPLLLAVRLVMGMLEGMSFPAVHDLSARSFPPETRAGYTSLIGSGINIGMIAGFACSPLVAVDWTLIFYVPGALGVMWTLIYLRYCPTPEEALNNYTPVEGLSRPAVPPATNGEADEATAEEPPGTSLRPILLSRPAFAIYVMHFGYLYGLYVFMGWLPRYALTLGVDVSTGGLLIALSYAAGAVGAVASGRLSDRLLSQGMATTRIRKVMQSISTLGMLGALAVLIAAELDGALQCTVLLCGANFLHSFANAGYFVNVIDIAPSQAGVVMGITNTMANFAGVVGNSVTGWILEAYPGQWWRVWLAVMVVEGFGWLVYVFWASSARLDQPAENTKTGA